MGGLNNSCCDSSNDHEVVDWLVEKEAVRRRGDVVLLIFQRHHVQVQQVAVHLAIARRRVPPTVRQHPDTLRTLTKFQQIRI